MSSISALSITKSIISGMNIDRSSINSNSSNINSSTSCISSNSSGGVLCCFV